MSQGRPEPAEWAVGKLPLDAEQQVESLVEHYLEQSKWNPTEARRNFEGRCRP